jgi:catechol 2,3-dioxygenase-like lactoylglutathione lyase family enzyme
VQSVAAVGLTVEDMDRSLDFFTTVLTFEKLSDVEVTGESYEHLKGLFGLRMRVVHLRLGDEVVQLTDFLVPQGAPVPADSRSNDVWFQHIAIVVRDMDLAYRWLRQNHVEHASTGPQRLPDWNPNAGGIQAFYFKDPDGHALEVIWFPKGKGDSRWQRAAGGPVRGETLARADIADLFLGIDHTAIVVRDTEASLRFYRDLLGMRVAGTSENWGTEQEHLNNVFGARLRITALRTDHGPGIEFLEYLSPRDGRPYPAGARANDLVHWQTTLVTADLPRLVDRLRATDTRFISPGAIALPRADLGFDHAFLVRDPDGHVLEVVNTWQMQSESNPPALQTSGARR